MPVAPTQIWQLPARPFLSSRGTGYSLNLMRSLSSKNDHFSFGVCYAVLSLYCLVTNSGKIEDPVDF